MKTTILRVVLDVPLYRLFDYLSDAPVPIGSRVLVPFGRRQLVGVVWEHPGKSELALSQLKPIDAVIDERPVIDPQWKKYCEWLSDYYHHPLGEVCFTVLPTLLRKNTPALTKPNKNPLSVAELQTALMLNEAQAHAVHSIQQHLNTHHTFLLQGVTASGKTEVYLQVIQTLVESGKQALVLIPEISLTPQTITRFTERFGTICVALHSGLTDRQRLNNWIKARSGDAKIIIGTRSAIFTPLKNPGVIIIDESHDLSFKQQEGLRYSAHDFAIYRAQQENIPIVLGSATPSLESLLNAKARFTLLTLPTRATAAPLPCYHIIDMRNQSLVGGLSETLLKQCRKHLEKQQQVLLFLNRRGFAPVLFCHSCGWSAECARCHIHYTLHQRKHRLICHHCDGTRSIPIHCPQCEQETLMPVGAGTERIETVLAEQFSDAEIVRIDRDTTRKKNDLTEHLAKINKNHPLILVGTQMLAKGHHFPHVGMVGIMDVDHGFYSSDFRALERMGQLITQVAGRAGRAAMPGEVFIQTHQPEHPLLQQLLIQGYTAFAETLLAERKACVLPPYSHLALLRAESTNETAAQQFLQQVKQQVFHAAVQVLGPTPAPMAKRAGKHRAQLLMIANQRKPLHELLRQVTNYLDKNKLARTVRWSIDVDPQEMV